MYYERERNGRLGLAENPEDNRFENHQESATIAVGGCNHPSQSALSRIRGRGNTQRQGVAWRGAVYCGERDYIYMAYCWSGSRPLFRVLAIISECNARCYCSPALAASHNIVCIERIGLLERSRLRECERSIGLLPVSGKRQCADSQRATRQATQR